MTAAIIANQAKDESHVVVGNKLIKGNIFIPKGCVLKVKGHVRPKGSADSSLENRLILAGSCGYGDMQ